MKTGGRSARLYVVDAFTHKAFGGNSAAVVLLEPRHLPLADAARQAIAVEMNLSETAFLEAVPADGQSVADGDGFKRCSRFVLRWFTPAKEVPLCGHATLASAAALWTGEGNAADTLHFDTVHSGRLSVSRGGTPERPLLHMDLPIREPTDPVPSGITADSDVVTAAGISPVDVEDVVINSQLQYLTVVLRRGLSRKQFEAIQPDFGRMHAASTDGEVFAVALTIQADKEGSTEHDVWSRFFAPWAGITEDPVTGSLHASIGPYWAKRLGHGGEATKGSVAKPAQELRCRQCSARGGELLVCTDWEGERVRVSGGAVMTVSGQIMLPS